MIFAQQSTSCETIHDTGITGLVGMIEVMLIDNLGGIVLASSAADCVETPAGSGIYAFTRTAPGTTGQFSFVASTDGSYDPGTVSEEDLIVSESTVGPFEPLPSPGQSGAPSMGPCSAWTTPEVVAECCGADVGVEFLDQEDGDEILQEDGDEILLESSNPDIAVYEPFIDEASEFLWALSGRRFSGSCQKTHARPCGTQNECGVQTLAWGRRIGWGGSRWEGVSSCGCTPLGAIPLSGYPVREIVEVLIDGAVVDPVTYELQRHRELVRMNDPATGAALYWPSCQNMHRPPTADGTFAVTYLYGLDPPRTGQRAAADLACQLYRSCQTSAGGDATDCSLPAGVTRVTRNGVTIERQAFGAWAYHPSLRIWRSGIPSVDGFLNWANPSGLRRRPAIGSPDGPKYARAV